MYVEERIYTMHIAKVPDYFKLYEAEGMTAQLRHLPHMVGYYVTEVGPLNVVTHLWAYEDLNQRERCRTALFQDPEWLAYVAKMRPLLVSQESRIHKCAPFFVERLKKMIGAAK